MHFNQAKCCLRPIVAHLFNVIKADSRDHGTLIMYIIPLMPYCIRPALGTITPAPPVQFQR